MLNIPLDDERTLSIEQFCEVEGLSREEFGILSLVVGAAPATLEIIGKEGAKPIIRITPLARRRWHARLALEFESVQIHDGLFPLKWEPPPVL